MVKCLFCFFFPWNRKCTGNKTCFFITFAVAFLTIHNYLSFFVKHLNNTFETILSCTLVIAWNYYVDYQTAQTGLRTSVTSKMMLFMTIFDSFFSLKIVTKISILDVAGVLDLTLTTTTDIFASQSWILISFKQAFPLYRNRSVSSNGKEDGWCS